MKEKGGDIMALLLAAELRACWPEAVCLIQRRVALWNLSSLGSDEVDGTCHCRAVELSQLTTQVRSIQLDWAW